MIQPNLQKCYQFLGDDVDFSINDIDGKPVSLKFKDGSTSVNYMLSDLSVIPNVPDLKQLPDFICRNQIRFKLYFKIHQSKRGEKQMRITLRLLVKMVTMVLVKLS